MNRKTLLAIATSPYFMGAVVFALVSSYGSFSSSADVLPTIGIDGSGCAFSDVNQNEVHYCEFQINNAGDNPIDLDLDPTTDAGSVGAEGTDVLLNVVQDDGTPGNGACSTTTVSNPVTAASGSSTLCVQMLVNSAANEGFYNITVGTTTIPSFPTP